MPINTVNQLGKPESLVRPGQNETKLEVPQAFKDFVAARSFGRAAVPESLATEFQHLDGSHLNAYVEVKDQQDTLDSYTDTLRKRAHHKPGLLLRTGHGIKEAAQDGVIKDINELALANIHDDSKSAIHDADKNAFNTTEDVIKGFEAVSEGAAIVSDVLKVYHGQQQIRAGQAKIKDYKNTVNEFRQKSQALIDDVNNYNKNMEIVKEYLPNAGQGGASPEQAINRRLAELQDVRELHDAVVKTESNIGRYRLSNDPRIASERYRLTNLKKQLDQQQSELTELKALRSAKQQLEQLSARLSNPRTIKDIATLADQAKRLHASKLVGELKGGTGQIMNTSAAAVDGIAHGVKFTDLAWPAFHALGQALAAKIAGIVLFPIKAKGAVVDAYTAHQHRTFAASADTLIRQYERTFPPDPELSAIARQVKTKQTWKGKATSATQNTLLTSGAGIMSGVGIAMLAGASVPALLTPVGWAIIGVGAGVALGYGIYKACKHLKLQNKVAAFQQALEIPQNTFDQYTNLWPAGRGMMASAADREKIDNLFRSLMKLDPDDRNVTITPQQVDELRRKAAQGLLENDAPLASERLFRRIQIEGNDGATAQFLKTFGFDNTHIEALTNVDPAKTDKVVDAVNLITEKLHLAPA